MRTYTQLEPWQKSYIKKAQRIRRKLTDKYLANKFDLTVGSIHQASRRARNKRNKT
jgi:hypothetical protein